MFLKSLMVNNPVIYGLSVSILECFLVSYGRPPAPQSLRPFVPQSFRIRPFLLFCKNPKVIYLFMDVPQPRAHIPKADGRKRPIGLPVLEDKIVQRAVVEVLNAIYEQDFLGFSYGFRPNRSPHRALDALSGWDHDEEGKLGA
jgi:hypothetical protein